MGREIKGKKFQLKIQVADDARRIKCPPVKPARFRSSPPCGELSRRAWSTAQCRGNFSSGTVAPFRREKTRRRTQDRHAAARCVRKVAQDRDEQPPIPATLRSQGKMWHLADASTPGKMCGLKGNILKSVPSGAT